MDVQQNISNRIIEIMQEKQSNDEEINAKEAFLMYSFELIEEVEPDDCLDICNEQFPKFGIGFDGFYCNLDETSINLYIAYYEKDNPVNTKLDETQFKGDIAKALKAINMAYTGDFKKIDPSNDMYDFLQSIYEHRKDYEVIINYVTNIEVPSNLKIDNVCTIEEHDIGVKIYDIQDLESRIEGKDDIYKLNLKEKFGDDFNAVKISSTEEFDIYMTSVKGNILADLYRADSVRLLESNVRSYLKKTSRVNKGIYETVKNSPEEFAAYNNGLATVATGAEVQEKERGFYRISSLTNWQIVNGGQTTATLYECSKDKLDLKKIIVPCKITVLRTDDDPQNLISNISIYSNTQTAIKKSDPPSNLKYYIDLKHLSDETWASKKDKKYLCFFERTNGEFNTAKRRNNYSSSFKNKYPIKSKFTKLDLAKAIVCWEQHPDMVNMGQEKNFEYFNNIIKDQQNDLNQTYYKRAYATILLFRAIDKIVKDNKYSYKSNVTTYTLALLSYMSDKQYGLDDIWSNQAISDTQKREIESIIGKVHTKLISANFAETRMWARKKECWEDIKKIANEVEVEPTGDKIEFFEVNEPKIFIENMNNMMNPEIWKKLLEWNTETNILKGASLNMVKGMIYNASSNKPITIKQKGYASSIFLKAVHAGFKYK